MTTRTAGQFSYDGQYLTGPEDYMKDKGNDKVDAILAGNDAAYNTMMTAKPESDPVTMVLVMLQTDYAGWRGAKQLIDSLKSSLPLSRQGAESS